MLSILGVSDQDLPALLACGLLALVIVVLLGPGSRLYKDEDHDG